MRLIVEATAESADAKAKSRWTRCLRFATRRRVKPKEVLWFIEHTGGISGCAEMFAAGKIRVPKGMWAYRTPGYIVPMFFDLKDDPPPKPKQKIDPLWD